MTVGVVGLGFVGLTAAVGFALKGQNVLGYDKDNNKLRQISNGTAPFYEKDFDKSLSEALRKGFYTTDRIEELTKESDIIFICIGTPSTSEGADLSHLHDSIRKIAGVLNNYTVLVIKSTVPPGTSRELAIMMERKGIAIGKQVGLVNNPEFLREGVALKDFIEPDRIVIGEYDQKSGDVVESLYKPFNAPVWRVSLTTAEFVKYLSNTLLSTLISFSNETATFAETVGDVDVRAAFQILHKDKRWYGSPASMTSYAWPGCGFGGYCLPKDTYALIKKAEKMGVKMDLLRAVLEVNNQRKAHLVDLLQKKLGDINGKIIAVLGLAFKPDTDDVRDTPAAEIIKILLEKGARVIAYDPMAVDTFKESYDFQIEYAGSLEQSVKSADGVFVTTAWEEFADVSRLFPDKVILDGRYLLR